MLFYTTLQLVGVGAIIKLSEWEKLQRQEYQIEKINK
jgi:hypothetical protein